MKSRKVPSETVPLSVAPSTKTTTSKKWSQSIIFVHTLYNFNLQGAFDLHKKGQIRDQLPTNITINQSAAIDITTNKSSAANVTDQSAAACVTTDHSAALYVTTDQLPAADITTD